MRCLCFSAYDCALTIPSDTTLLRKVPLHPLCSVLQYLSRSPLVARGAPKSLKPWTRWRLKETCTSQPGQFVFCVRRVRRSPSVGIGRNLWRLSRVPTPGMGRNAFTGRKVTSTTIFRILLSEIGLTQILPTITRPPVCSSLSPQPEGTRPPHLPNRVHPSLLLGRRRNLYRRERTPSQKTMST